MKEAATQRCREAPVWPKCPLLCKGLTFLQGVPPPTHTHTLLSPLGTHGSSQEGTPLKPLSAAQTRMVFAHRARGAGSIPHISFTSVRLGRYKALASIPGRTGTVRLNRGGEMELYNPSEVKPDRVPCEGKGVESEQVLASPCTSLPSPPAQVPPELRLPEVR